MAHGHYFSVFLEDTWQTQRARDRNDGRAVGKTQFEKGNGINLLSLFWMSRRIPREPKWANSRLRRLSL